MHWKMLTGSSLWFCKIIPKAAGGKLILAHFPCSQWEVGTREHRPITEKEILRRISVSIFKISKLFQRSKEKIYNCIRQWKAFERPWKPSAHTQKVMIKMFRPSKKYPSRDTVPFNKQFSVEDLCRSEDHSYHLVPFILNRQPESTQMCQVAFKYSTAEGVWESVCFVYFLACS